MVAASCAANGILDKLKSVPASNNRPLTKLFIFIDVLTLNSDRVIIKTHIATKVSPSCSGSRAAATGQLRLRNKFLALRHRVQPTASAVVLSFAFPVQSTAHVVHQLH